ncbi:hypothetical protein D1831_08695 [Lactiplantibacillus garii]|uniref:YdbS-like PH domain-containing protein n=1 Tax=Lactiplantibacillus garii TaxID=2306423 RepID=A0A426D6M9_9LACO|nr:PH domain-containing protein [Lactiplantibacillus garii]RRK10230.1 hypothetical protein D1831_08695 [Lactiplantibacillus garii]
MQAEQLPRRIKTVWCYAALISGGVGLLISAALWLAHTYWHWWGWLPVLGVVLSLLDVVVELGLIPYRYAFWRYRITENAVYLSSGVFFKKQVAIPIGRIQNVTLAAGPLLQLVKLQAVTVETAAASDKIDGVTPAVADQLREQIIRLAREARDEA